MQVDTVKQGPGNLRTVIGNAVGAAVAATVLVAQVATGTGVHRGNELYTRRKIGLVCRPRDRDSAGLEWLAEYLQHVAIELRQFIEKQHTVVRPGNFARAGAGAASNDRRRRGRVMRRAERPLPPASKFDWLAEHRIDTCRFQRLRLAHRRKNSR